MRDATPRSHPRRIPWTVAGLVLLGIASLIPDFRPSIIPSHDARQTLSALHMLASGLRSEGEIPQWLPYGRYGHPGFIMMVCVSPAAYETALASTMFPPVSAVVLLKIVMLVEFLVFLAGSIRLSLLLYRELAAVALVNVGAILSFSWLSSLDASLHYFYMLPFLLDSLIRFTRDGRFTWLLLAALFGVVSAIGNVYYYPPLMAMILSVFFGVLLWTRWGRIPAVRFSRTDLLLAAPILILAGAHAGGYVLNFRDMHTYTEGRDPATSKVLLSYFLEYNGVTTLLNLATVLFTGAHTHGDVTFYAGLAPLALALLALLRRRRSELVAVASAAGFLLLFSFGGLVARASYYFPGMSYYRNIFMVFGQFRYLLLLMAGFGLETLRPETATAPEEGRRPGARLLASLAGLVAVAEVAWSLIREEHPWHFVLLPQTMDLPWRDSALPLLRAAAYGVLIGAADFRVRGRPPAERVSACIPALLAAFLLDLGSFKVRQFVAWPAASAQEVALSNEVYAPRPLPYQPVRVSSDDEKRRSPGFRFAVEDGVRSTCVYAHVYSVLGVDPRMPVYRVDMLGADLDRLFRIRGVEFRQFPAEDQLPRGDRWLQDALGARLPKLRVCEETSVDFSASPEAVRTMPLDSDRIVVAAPPPRTAPGRSGGTVHVTSFGFNHLALEATVAGSDSAWLYYADADHPGWTATVDGTPAPVSRANLAFKAVALHPGLNRVAFRYWNGWGSLCLPVLCAGSALFLAGLGASFAIAVARRLRTPASAGT